MLRRCNRQLVSNIQFPTINGYKIDLKSDKFGYRWGTRAEWMAQPWDPTADLKPIQKTKQFTVNVKFIDPDGAVIPCRGMIGERYIDLGRRYGAIAAYDFQKGQANWDHNNISHASHHVLINREHFVKLPPPHPYFEHPSLHSLEMAGTRRPLSRILHSELKVEKEHEGIVIAHPFGADIMGFHSPIFPKQEINPATLSEQLFANTVNRKPELQIPTDNKGYFVKQWRETLEFIGLLHQVWKCRWADTPDDINEILHGKRYMGHRFFIAPPGWDHFHNWHSRNGRHFEYNPKMTGQQYLDGIAEEA